jgi:hypothetical protein
MPFWKTFGIIVKATALVIVAGFCLLLLALLTLPIYSEDAREAVFKEVGVQLTEDFIGETNADLPKDLRELPVIRQDHYAIVNRILDCDRLSWTDAIGYSTRSNFILPTESDIRNVYKLEFINDSAMPGAVHLDRIDKALIELSKILAEQRLELSRKVRSWHAFWEFGTIVSILIGMITTILVSLSATEIGRGDGPRQHTVRVLAIVFPALGTATAAIIGFYSPQAEWTQASRTLASETQLHGQMAISAWALDCPGENADDNIATSPKHMLRFFKIQPSDLRIFRPSQLQAELRVMRGLVERKPTLAHRVL